MVEVGCLLALPHRVAEHELGGVVARVVAGRAARVELQQGRPRDADGAAKGHCDVDFGALPVHPVGGRRADAKRGSRRHLDQLHGAALGRGDDRVGAAAQLKGVDAECAVEPVKAARAVGGRAGREQGAVAGAHADQLDAVVGARGDRGVRRAVAELERGDAKGVAELLKAARAVGRRPQWLQGAVCVDADQLDAVVALGGDQGVRASAAQVERGDVARAVERQAGVVGAVFAERPARLQGAVSADAHQLDAVVVVPRDEGVRGAAQAERGDAVRAVELQGGVVAERPARLQRAVSADAHQLDAVVAGRCGDQGVRLAVHVEGGDAAGAVEHQGGVVAERPARLQGAVCVDAHQLDAAVGAVLGGDDRVGGAAARLERVDAVGPAEPPKVGIRVAGHRDRLQGAVFVHAHKLDGAFERGHRGVRAAPDGDRVGVQGVGERVKAVPPVARRPGRDRPRDDRVDQHVARMGQRAGGARGRQRKVRRMPGKVRHASGQGGRPAVAEVVGAVARRDRVDEH